MPVGAEDRLELVNEVVDVLELPIDRGKADECDLVDRAQAVEHLFTDVTRGDLAVEVLIDVRLDVANNGLNLTFAHGPLVARLFAAGTNLLAVERNPGSVFVDDLEGRLLDLFVGGEPALANQAFPAAADHEVLARAGIDHLRFPVAAERAHHMRIT